MRVIFILLRKKTEYRWGKRKAVEPESGLVIFKTPRTLIQMSHNLSKKGVDLNWGENKS